MGEDRFETVAPGDVAKPFVRRYLYANRRLRKPLTFHPKPTGYAYLSSFFGRSHGDFWEIDGSRHSRTDRWFLYGQITDHAVTFRHAETIELIVCELSPTAPGRLFAIPGPWVVGLAAALGRITATGVRLAEEIFTLGTEASRDEHVAEADRYFSALADVASAPDQVVELAIAMFEAANGAVRVADVAREAGVAPRELNRRFTRAVGLSPKFFGHTLQMNWAAGLLYSNDRVTLTRVAHEAGFYDQAHFNHAMRRFFREGPGEFLRSDHVEFTAFLGTSRRYGPNAPL